MAEFQSLRDEAVEGLDGEPGGDLVQGGSVASLQGSFNTREELHRQVVIIARPCVVDVKKEVVPHLLLCVDEEPQGVFNGLGTKNDAESCQALLPILKTSYYRQRIAGDAEVNRERDCAAILLLCGLLVLLHGEEKQISGSNDDNDF